MRPTLHRTGSGSALVRLAVVTTALVACGFALAGPAAAEVPAQGWPENEPVSLLHALLLIGGVTLVVMLVITVVVVGPALARGESIAPGVTPVEDQWLGGPRKPAGELAGPEGVGAGGAGAGGADSSSGGAGARW